VGLFTGAATVEFPAALFLEQPAFWLETISWYGGRISAAPNFAYDLLGTIPESALESLSLQHWKLAISGGEIVRPATFRRLVERLACRGFSARAFTPYYGLTETLCTTLRQSGQLTLLRVDRAALGRHEVRVVPETSEDAVELVSNGRPLGSVEVCVADPATRRPLQPGTVGEVWVGGAGVTPGYLNQEALNAEVVRAALDSSEPGRWFRTGDLGFLHDGELFITGRLKELIIVRGRNLYPADLERGVMTALASAPVAECAAFSHETAEGEGVAIAVELKRGAELTPPLASDLAARVQSALIQSAGVACAAVVVLPTGSLPRTATAKVQRGRCRQLLQSGAWVPTVATSGGSGAPGAESPLEPVDETSTVGRLRRVVGGVLGRTADRVDPDRSLAELGLDSLGAVRLLSAMEAEFGVRVGIGTLLTAPQLRHLAATLDRMVARRGAVEVDEPVEYDAELAAVQSLCLGLKPRGSSSTATPHVFLTGATGFLGSYLLRDLLRVEGTRVTCLVRGDSAAMARTRLLQKLGGIPGWNPTLNERIEVCCGSLEDPFLGLGEAGLNTLASSVTRIVHNGANVNFVAPYSFLRAVNVTSNLGVLRLAVAGGGLPVHYVSTTAVFNGPDRDRLERIRESDFLASPDSLFSGYAQTKWVSERLWREAATLGVPVAIHRPGLVTGDCETGAWHTDDFLCRFIKGCLQMGRFPDLAVEVDMIPVDVVSTAMARAITDAATGGPLTAYHWTHPAPARMAALAAWFQSAGWPVQVEAVADWMASMRSLDDRNALFPLTPFLLQRVGPEGETLFEFFGRRRLNLDRVHAAALMQRSAIRCPDPIADLMPRYAKHLVETGFLPAPPSPISR
jgi:thioester reductase-like protein